MSFKYASEFTKAYVLRFRRPFSDGRYRYLGYKPGSVVTDPFAARQYGDFIALTDLLESQNETALAIDVIFFTQQTGIENTSV